MRTIELVLLVYALAFAIGMAVAFLVRWIGKLSAMLDLQFDPMLRHEYYRLKRIKKYHKEQA